MAINYEKKAKGVCKGCSNYLPLDEGWVCLFNDKRYVDACQITSCENKESASPYIILDLETPFNEHTNQQEAGEE